RVMIGAADDDQIFQPSGHEDLAAIQEPEISGAEERTAAVQPRSKRALGLLCAAPVAWSDAAVRDPNLADAPIVALGQRSRIDDENRRVAARAAAPHQVADSRPVGRRFDRDVLLE